MPRTRSIVIVALALALSACRPRRAPTAAVVPEWIRGQLADATQRANRERAEEFLEAFERGEDREAYQVNQTDIDHGANRLELLFRYGDGFFEHQFHREEGFGTGTDARARRIQVGSGGGLDSFSCAGCHSVGGPDGAGSETQNVLMVGDGDDVRSALVRNAPSLLGVGFVQALGAEMSQELSALRAEAVRRARESGQPVTIELMAKGVSFGSLTAHPDSTIDVSAIRGVADDLVVRPFGWKGHTARLRRFAEDAARIHFGMQSHVLVEAHRDAPDVAHLGAGPHWWDPDADGVPREIEEGTLTAAAVYLSMLETPAIVPPEDRGLRARWARGQELYRQIGCGDCHRESLRLESSIWRESPDTTGGPPVVLDLLRDGESPRGMRDVALFSDLRRHDMGADLADPRDDPSGVARTVFLTRPLWGLADSGPYLHDGRAPTIPEAILAHGGEAQRSREQFESLTTDDRASVHVFLLSLTRMPRLDFVR